MNNSANSASSSSPPNISMDHQLQKSMSNSARSVSSSASSTSSSSPPIIPMDPQLRQLLKACNKGDFSLCNSLVLADPDILLSTTPHKNNCLHIAAMLGHHEFAREAWSRAPSLFSGTNIDGETLIAALMAANLSLASDIITAASQYVQHNDLEEGRSFNRMLLKVDRRKENALHHAMRNGFENLALQLLEIEPQLSEQVTNTGKSPMYMAARRGYSRVTERLLQIQSSANSRPRTESDLPAAVRLENTGYSEVVERLLEIPSPAVLGPNYHSAMHAAVIFDHPDIVKQLLEGQSQLAYHKDKDGYNPMHRAVLDTKLKLVKIFLEYDPNLAYIKHEPTGNTPFTMAVAHGSVLIAKELMNTCPDSIYTPTIVGDNALHFAIGNEKPDSVNYILSTPQLHRFINQANNYGYLPLHIAAQKCDPNILRSLLTHAGQDYTAVNLQNNTAIGLVYLQTALWKTLKWNESFTLLSNIIPSSWNYLIRDKYNRPSSSKQLRRSSHLQQSTLPTPIWSLPFSLLSLLQLLLHCQEDSVLIPLMPDNPFLQGKQFFRCSLSLTL